MKPRKAEFLKEQRRAVAAFEALDPEGSDEEIAAVVADYLVSWTDAHYSLVILHDVRKSSPGRIAAMRTIMGPEWQPDQPTGPSPIRYDWARKNMVGIRARAGERDRPHAWAIEAMLLGYAVCHWIVRGFGFTKGTIAEVRQQAQDRRANEARLQAKRLEIVK